MSQFQQNPYGDPQDEMAGQPRKTSGIAITALILSIVGLIPCIGVCTAPFGILLGLISAVMTGSSSAKKGRGLAITAIIIGLLAAGVQYGTWTVVQKNFIKPVEDGPKSALLAGFSGDIAGFRAAMHTPASNATDEEITAYIETLRQRYGNLNDVVFDELRGSTSSPQFGATSQVFPYLLQFDSGTVDADAEIVFSDQTTGQAWVMKPSVITIIDPDLGDITFPAGATSGGSSDADVADDDAAAGDSVTDESETDDGAEGG